MAESQDWGKMSPGSLCEKEEKGRNLIVYVLITEQSSNLPKRFAFLCQSGRIRSFMCVRGGGGKKRQRWVDFLALDNEMFSPYSTNTPPFFQPSSRFFFFLLVSSCYHKLTYSPLLPLVLLPQKQSRPAPKTALQAAHRVSLQFWVHLRKQVSLVWLGCKTSPDGVSEW